MIRGAKFHSFNLLQLVVLRMVSTCEKSSATDQDHKLTIGNLLLFHDSHYVDIQDVDLLMIDDLLMTSVEVMNTTGCWISG